MTEAFGPPNERIAEAVKGGGVTVDAVHRRWAMGACATGERLRG